MEVTSLDHYQRRRITLLRPLLIDIRDAARRGEAVRNAASQVGLSEKRMRALWDRWMREGDLALIERRKLPRGRTSAAERLQISQAERDLLRQFTLKCDSKQLAIETLADDPRCSEDLRQLIARYRLTRNYPKALLAAAHVTPEERSLARGHRTHSLAAHTQWRDMTYIDDTGRHAMTGGDLWECDDISINEPFWYEWPYGGDPLSDMFGVRLGRQVLAAVDVATGKWLGFDMIGRVRDAYRAEDVVRFLGRLCHTYGIPRLGYRLERGVWMSNSVRGIKGTSDDDEQKTILGSVRDVVDIEFVYSPKAKGIIEGSFDFLQSIQALTGVTVGRRRGEYEATTKAALACAAARKHPADCGFKHISEAADILAASMARSDARPKDGRLLKGVPADKWSAAITERPLPGVPETKVHLFLPVKQVRPIDSGFLRRRVPHYGHTFSFAVPDHCAHLGARYDLLICFDPADPYSGARVFDAASDRLRHFDSAPEQYYGVFPFAPDAPRIDRRSDKSGRSSHKRDYTAASRTIFRATGMQVGTGASIDQASDGKGNSARIVRGELAKSTEPGQHTEPANPAAAAALQARRKHVQSSGRTMAKKYAGLSSSELLCDREEIDFDPPPSRINSEALL